MPILLQLAQSYSNPDDINYKLAYLREQVEQQLLSLGDLAYADQVQLAMLGETIQIGGYIRTELIAAKSILAEHLNVDSLSAISSNIGEIDSGTITGAIIRTSAESDRIELSNNLLRSYSSGVRRVQLDYDSLDFYNPDGTKGGEIIGVYSDIWELPVLMLRSDTGVIEMESRISSNNYARIEVVAGHPNIDSPAHVAIEVYQPSVGGLGGIEVGPGGVMTSGFMYVDGDFEVYGQKSAAVETENYGMRKLYALEAPENRFITYIERELEPGEHYIEIEPMFRETISNYFVVPHIQNVADVSIIERDEKGFKVLVENKKAEVVFEVNGIRKGYEGIYMEEARHDFEQYRLARLIRGEIIETGNSGHKQGDSDTETSDRGLTQ